uniref:Uncharacterized protein n=1 Tax=Chromera velia CCMP2878 TaxID=1169474 RepID=A0A0G4FD77_9ALVE|mmetsp:Transcript_24581/g.48242  ORF Transcript_24581/g.48242 Transcript_24581/m.48242 type:complete len:280 (-) Transcript_24581:61-900(-)|eukprot:Cvel_16460.t1-p1 / transcript=Cvel_16460.t1 / gene=Cvel_16460 / organism=Chromera_velia_CCMP2878 / gene_product=hypothetical protein / transcript_product=hypothetical protein / location=Cvel_scaffold1268:45665-46501(-) / protein_length=279 / sequence_SO=supercontig / SO=protein_coding / is_pseudo=false
MSGGESVGGSLSFEERLHAVFSRIDSPSAALREGRPISDPFSRQQEGPGVEYEVQTLHQVRDGTENRGGDGDVVMGEATTSQPDPTTSHPAIPERKGFTLYTFEEEDDAEEDMKMKSAAMSFLSELRARKAQQGVGQPAQPFDSTLSGCTSKFVFKKPSFRGDVVHFSVEENEGTAASAPSQTTVGRFGSGTARVMPECVVGAKRNAQRRFPAGVVHPSSDEETEKEKNGRGKKRNSADEEMEGPRETESEGWGGDDSGGEGELLEGETPSGGEWDDRE